MAVNARTEEFQHIEVFDKPALFTNWRIARDTVPKGWYCYDIRGSDDDPGELCYIAQEGPRQVFATADVQKRHVSHHDVNPLVLCKNPPLSTAGFSGAGLLWDFLSRGLGGLGLSGAALPSLG